MSEPRQRSRCYASYIINGHRHYCREKTAHWQHRVVCGHHQVPHLVGPTTIIWPAREPTEEPTDV